MNVLKSPFIFRCLSRQVSVGRLDRGSLRSIVSVMSGAFILITLGAFAASGQTTAPTQIAPAPSAKASTPATGVISGVVLGDDGQPLADAQVFIGSARGANLYGGRSVNTQPDGRFRFTGLRLGAYVLLAESAGYTMPEFDEPQDHRSTYRVGANVTLNLVKGGVITGSVTDVTGAPLIEMPVRAMRVRDGQGRKAQMSPGSPQGLTDDRGTYRIYGLPPGSYLVSAGAIASHSSSFDQIDMLDGAPSYFPSSSLDAATEVQVNAGQETGGIDIRVRGEAGHDVSGIVVGTTKSPDGKDTGAVVTLRRTNNGAQLATTFVGQMGSKMTFSFSGLADGEYDLIAETWRQEGGSAAPPQRLVVKGADIAGVQLVLARLGSISGRIVLETNPMLKDKPECTTSSRPVQPEEFSLDLRRNATAKQIQFEARLNQRGTAPDEQGKFSAFGLTAGAYRLRLDFPDERQFIRSITTPGPAGKTVDVGRTGFNLSSGENLTYVSINVMEGAAGLTGRIAPPEGGPQLPQRTLLHLVPAEAGSDTDVLRYREVEVGTDGVFAFANLTPGKYWLFTAPIPFSETLEPYRRPAAWDPAARLKLHKAAETANQTIELRPCQRQMDYVLHLTPAAPPSP
jgi:hypothetical protein